MSSDLQGGFLQLLSQLTIADNIHEEFFCRRLSLCDGSNTHVLVAVDRESGRVLAAGTVVVEFKFIHECGLVGHIEDVVVDRTLRRRGIGKQLVQKLCCLARDGGCYKVILDCAENNVPFYSACGFKRKEVMMLRYLESQPPGPTLQQAVAPQHLGNGLLVRSIRSSDYDGQVLPLLEQLTSIGTISREFFTARVAALGDMQHMLVIEDEDSGRVVSTGTLLVEAKFIHQAGLAGHIEDIVVDSTVRGKGLGKLIIQKLVEVAVAAGCYKVILDCAQKNIAFYEKCGFIQKEVQMAMYF